MSTLLVHMLSLGQFGVHMTNYNGATIPASFISSYSCNLLIEQNLAYKILTG